MARLCMSRLGHDAVLSHCLRAQVGFGYAFINFVAWRNPECRLCESSLIVGNRLYVEITGDSSDSIIDHKDSMGFTGDIFKHIVHMV